MLAYKGKCKLGGTLASTDKLTSSSVICPDHVQIFICPLYMVSSLFLIPLKSTFFLKIDTNSVIFLNTGFLLFLFSPGFLLHIYMYMNNPHLVSRNKCKLSFILYSKELIRYSHIVFYDVVFVMTSGTRALNLRLYSMKHFVSTWIWIFFCEKKANYFTED